MDDLSFNQLRLWKCYISSHFIFKKIYKTLVYPSLRFTQNKNKIKWFRWGPFTFLDYRTIWHWGQFGTRTIWHLRQFGTIMKRGQFGTVMKRGQFGTVIFFIMVQNCPLLHCGAKSFSFTLRCQIVLGAKLSSFTLRCQIVQGSLPALYSHLFCW